MCVLNVDVNMVTDQPVISYEENTCICALMTPLDTAALLTVVELIEKAGGVKSMDCCVDLELSSNRFSASYLISLSCSLLIFYG